ncbi:MAG: ROK family protein [Gemmatimonadales bacterium]|nr:ROK family protein [Gemmatimonadales bacterium]
MVAVAVAEKRVIGVDLGGTKILAGKIERDGTIVASSERPTPVASQEELLRALDEVVEDVLGTAQGVVAVGLGIPSRIDHPSGRAVGSVNIPLADLDLRTRMEERFGLIVGLENDANAAALAEWTLGAGRGTRDMVMLTLGTGVGGGVVVDGRLYRGWAEFGHIVVLHDGPPCQGSCTGHGHLETLASGTAAQKAAVATFGPEATAEELVRRATEGEEVAVRLLAEIGGYLGSGIASLVNIFNPQLVVLGGGFAAAGDLVFDAAREVVAREALQPAGELVRLVPARLGSKAGVIGAGLIGFEVAEHGA